MRKITPEKVSSLAEGEIFVFGSNAKGRHTGGAARVARKKFGAIPGQAHGRQGQSYAIDTMSGWQTLMAGVDDFLDYAKDHPELTFLVTPIGTGIAGYAPDVIAPLFAHAPANVTLPREFTPRAVVPAVAPRDTPEELAAARAELATACEEVGATKVIACTRGGGDMSASAIRSVAATVRSSK